MDLDSIYKTGISTSHVAGLQAVFNAGVASVQFFVPDPVVPDAAVLAIPIEGTVEGGVAFQPSFPTLVVTDPIEP